MPARPPVKGPEAAPPPSQEPPPHTRHTWKTWKAWKVFVEAFLYPHPPPWKTWKAQKTWTAFLDLLWPGKVFSISVVLGCGPPGGKQWRNSGGHENYRKPLFGSATCKTVPWSLTGHQHVRALGTRRVETKDGTKYLSVATLVARYAPDLSRAIARLVFIELRQKQQQQ